MMHDPIKVPARFTSATTRPFDEAAPITRSGERLHLSIYKTSIADQTCIVTISWYKNLLLHGFTLSIEGTQGNTLHCEVELKPGFFWRKQGLKHMILDGLTIGVAWDLNAAKFNGQTEPCSDYYVAVTFQEEIVLLIGDMKKDAFRRTSCRPTLVEPILICERHHIIGKRKFSTRFKLHEIMIECKNFNNEMEIKLDGKLLILVKNLKWNFRGNAMLGIDKTRVELCWDVHDWLYHSGLRHAIFVFKSGPLLMSQSHILSSQAGNDEIGKEYEEDDSSGFCLFVYAWKTD